MKYILTPNPNPPNNLRRFAPAYGGIEFQGWTEDEVLQRALSRAQASGLIPTDASKYYIVEEEDLPTDYYFFDAWEWTGSAVSVSMEKARAVHLTHIRRVRDEELIKEDITFMRAVEAGDTDAQVTIKTKKQTLRGLPATFDITTDVDTPEKLKAKWPAELPARE